MKMNRKLYREIEANGLYSCLNDEPFFSWHGCDNPECTEKGKGANVYEMKGYKNLSEAQNGNDNYYEYQLCEQCLNEMVNGIN